MLDEPYYFESPASQPAMTISQTQTNTTSAPVGMVYVEGGNFMMSSNDDSGAVKPVHRVTISSLYIGKYEVSQKEWRDVMGNEPSEFKGDDKPVEMVSRVYGAFQTEVELLICNYKLNC